MILRPEIASRVFNTPLMIAEGKALAILRGIGGRMSEGGFVLPENAEIIDHVAFADGRPSAGRLSDRVGQRYDAARQPTYDMVGNVAVIPIEGTLVHKGAFVGASSGKTSYQGLQTQIVRAARDPNVAGVAFEVDSFGGEVAGAFETSAMIADLSKIKPTIAILTDHALSAGYLLASGARQIVMPEHGRAGSIGVITMHADYSAALDKAGVKVTILAAGKRKADGNPYEALSPEARDATMASVEKARMTFAKTVGSNRGKRFNAAQALATEAEDFDGADAVALGLADAVGHASSAFDMFVRNLAR